jgi:hypothetical protein
VPAAARTVPAARLYTRRRVKEILRCFGNGLPQSRGPGSAL